jgi:hypothetical protein
MEGAAINGVPIDKKEAVSNRNQGRMMKHLNKKQLIGVVCVKIRVKVKSKMKW